MSGNTKDFKVRSGIQPTAYHEAVGTVVSNSVTVGYDLSVAVYDSVSFSVASQDGAPWNFQWKSDGTKFYVIGLTNDTVYQYSCSIAYDISTASYDSVSFSVASQVTIPYDLHFKSDGTKMYISDNTTDSIYQYTLSTAWNLSTASYDSVSFSVASQDTTPVGLTFGSSGTKMYIGGNTNDTVYQYTLSTAWDLSTASYDSKSLSVSSQDGYPSGLHFKSDGLTLYMFGGNNNSVYQYSLTTAWDISTASYDSISFSFLSQDNQAYGGTFNADGTKMYMIGATSDAIHQYSTGSTTTTNTLDLSTGSVFEITPTSDIQVTLTNPAASGTSSGATLLLDQQGYGGYDLGNGSFTNNTLSVSSQDANPTSFAFGSSGNKLYVLGTGNDAVYQYTLSTAYNPTTATYDSVSFSISSQETAPSGIAFKSDGTKMYVVGEVNTSVYQYSLSTAWDLSTASYDSVSFNLSSQGTPQEVTFKSDGTKMYIVTGTGTIPDSVLQYSLNTAWSVSTASYDSVSFSFSSQGSEPTGIAFKPDGTKLFITESANAALYEYNLSTAWDISSVSYASQAIDVSGEDLNPENLLFNSDGSRVYVIGKATDAIYEYTALTPASITYDSTLQWSGGTAPTAPAIGETDVLTFNTTDGGTTYKSVLAIDGAK